MFASAAQEARNRKAKPKPPVPQPVVITETSIQVTPIETKPETKPTPSVPVTPQPDAAFEKAVADAKSAASSLKTKAAAAEREFASDRGFHTFAQQAIHNADSLSERADDAEDLEDVQKIAQAIANDQRRLEEKTAALRALKTVVQPVKMDVTATTEKSDANREEIRKRLRDAYAAYASGKTDQCERTVSQLIASRMANDEAYLLRGVARYTKGVLTNQQHLVGDAATDFSAALTLNPAAKLDPKFFSPKVVSFFDDIRKRASR
jgi:hypothetical protein